MMEDYDPKPFAFNPESRVEMGRYWRTWALVAATLFVGMIIAIVFIADTANKQDAQRPVAPGQSTNDLTSHSIAPPTLNKTHNPPSTTGQGGDSN
jgi:hypothetical protein